MQNAQNRYSVVALLLNREERAAHRWINVWNYVQCDAIRIETRALEKWKFKCILLLLRTMQFIGNLQRATVLLCHTLHYILPLRVVHSSPVLRHGEGGVCGTQDEQRLKACARRRRRERERGRGRKREREKCNKSSRYRIDMDINLHA